MTRPRSPSRHDTNHKSTKLIVATALGEYVCKDHGGQYARPVPQPFRGVCYACAIVHGEHVRGKVDETVQV